MNRILGGFAVSLVAVTTALTLEAIPTVSCEVFYVQNDDEGNASKVENNVMQTMNGDARITMNDFVVTVTVNPSKYGGWCATPPRPRDTLSITIAKGESSSYITDFIELGGKRYSINLAVGNETMTVNCDVE